MRFSFQIVLFFLGITSSFSQVGIGTEYPEPSAALEILASDKGILIPRVSLQSITDQTTITGALSNGLLVFNTSTQNILLPGFYYWYTNSWHRIGGVNDTFIETITYLIDNQNGTYTYTNEEGTITIMDIPNAVVEDLLSQGRIYQQISTLFNITETLTFLQLEADGTSLEYIDEQGNAHLIDLLQIIRDNERTIDMQDGAHTTISETTIGNQTTYQVDVPVASGANALLPSSYGVVKELALEPQITLTTQGELLLNYENIYKVVSVTSDYMIVSNDAIILGNPMHSDIYINLPDPTTHKGKKYTVKKENNEEDYYVNVIGNIAGIPNQELYTAIPHSGWTFVSDGIQWRVESKF